MMLCSLVFQELVVIYVVEVENNDSESKLKKKSFSIISSF